MSRTDWTLELDQKLKLAVEETLKAGLHKIKGPSRSDNLYVGFWTAVAIKMADSAKSPTAAACAKRHPIALQRQPHTEAIDLQQWDEFYDAYDVEPYQQLAEELREMKERLDRLCAEWGV